MSTTAREESPSKRLIVGGILVVLIALAAAWVLVPKSSGPGDSTAQVGSDLHAVTTSGDRLFVSGHDGAAYSDASGSWTAIGTLAGKDAMAWSVGKNDIVVGGHEGAFRSTDNGATFTALTGLPVSDVHAAGATGTTAYIASPTGGFYASADSGQTWTKVGATGESFMGSLLVDPTNPRRVMAADVLEGVVLTKDGGRTWTVLGGIEGPIGLSWNPSNHQQIAVTAAADAGISLDGGTSWLALPVPTGTSAVSFDSSGRLLAAVRSGQSASVSVSADLGQSWTSR